MTQKPFLSSWFIRFLSIQYSTNQFSSTCSEGKASQSLAWVGWRISSYLFAFHLPPFEIFIDQEIRLKNWLRTQASVKTHSTCQNINNPAHTICLNKYSVLINSDEINIRYGARLRFSTFLGKVRSLNTLLHFSEQRCLLTVLRMCVMSMARNWKCCLDSSRLLCMTKEGWKKHTKSRVRRTHAAGELEARKMRPSKCIFITNNTRRS